MGIVVIQGYFSNEVNALVMWVYMQYFFFKIICGIHQFDDTVVIINSSQFPHK